jgi:hypothetical protein
VALDSVNRLGDSSPRPEGMQLATMLRCFAAVVHYPHHFATVPTYETWGGRESRALQVTLPLGPFFPFSFSTATRRFVPCGC